MMGALMVRSEPTISKIGENYTIQFRDVLVVIPSPLVTYRLRTVKSSVRISSDLDLVFNNWLVGFLEQASSAQNIACLNIWSAGFQRDDDFDQNESMQKL